MSDPVKLPVRLQTPAGPLAVDLITTEDKVRIDRVVPGVAQLSDALVATAITLTEQAGHAIQCRRGCSACCHQIIPVSPVEAFALLDAVDGMEPDRRASVEARFSAARDQIQSAGLSSSLDDVIAERAGREVVTAYFKQQIPCPFLEDGACGIYALRPMSCRELIVISDPAYCDNADGSGVRRIPMLTEMSQVLRGLSASIWGDAPTRMPLIRAVDWAREHRDLSDTVAKGTDLFRGILTLMGRQRGRGAAGSP